ncbi:hypothetical protein EO087_02590 [Dyella sp. M7H15-1]|uniref:Vgb family protein n=1 Tax=Dyella sp. M7H15-1 TaxID=2501295 RepID=UPI00100516F9|nr:hypothetical protein [Dyella sp. M7H15-1]QAU23014.1 hypothetical protein EO087_02590 [Dyella sp. M7H15-1]
MLFKVVSNVRRFTVSQQAFQMLTAMALLGMCAVPKAAHASDANNPNANYFIASNGSNQVMMYNEDTGKFLGVVAAVSAPVASQIGPGADLYQSAAGSGQVLRFDGFTGAYKGVFIDKGNGGLNCPTAPNFGPDGLVYVGDNCSNQMLRYTQDGKFVDVFADASSGLVLPFMQTFDQNYMYIAAGGTNQVIVYNVWTKQVTDRCVPPNPADMQQPIGLEIGPNGDLYAGSALTNSVVRFTRDGKGHCAFKDIFVPPGYGGISNPHAIRFGGPNSNLYVVSTGTNQVMTYDRVTGKFLGIEADGNKDGMSQARGLTFTPRPIFNVYAKVLGDVSIPGIHDFKHVHVDHELKDFSDSSPDAVLMSIDYSDKSVDVSKMVLHAHIGKPDYNFQLDFANRSGAEQHYTISYIATNSHGLTTMATTEVDVPPM